MTEICPDCGSTTTIEAAGPGDKKCTACGYEGDAKYFTGGYGRSAVKDPRFEGVGLEQDDDGWYVHTHRARGDSYPTPEDIPQDEVDWIESTGSKKTAATWADEFAKYDNRQLQDFYDNFAAGQDISTIEHFIFELLAEMEKRGLTKKADSNALMAGTRWRRAEYVTMDEVRERGRQRIEADGGTFVPTHWTATEFFEGDGTVVGPLSAQRRITTAGTWEWDTDDGDGFQTGSIMLFQDDQGSIVAGAEIAVTDEGFYDWTLLITISDDSGVHNALETSGVEDVSSEARRMCEHLTAKWWTENGAAHRGETMATKTAAQVFEFTDPETGKVTTRKSEAPYRWVSVDDRGKVRFHLDEPRGSVRHYELDAVDETEESAGMTKDFSPPSGATCTVIVGPEMEQCGQPAITAFTGRNGDELYECADHAPQSVLDEMDKEARVHPGKPSGSHPIAFGTPIVLGSGTGAIAKLSEWDFDKMESIGIKVPGSPVIMAADHSQVELRIMAHATKTAVAQDIPDTNGWVEDEDAGDDGWMYANTEHVGWVGPDDDEWYWVVTLNDAVGTDIDAGLESSLEAAKAACEKVMTGGGLTLGKTAGAWTWEEDEGVYTAVVPGSPIGETVVVRDDTVAHPGEWVWFSSDGGGDGQTFSSADEAKADAESVDWSEDDGHEASRTAESTGREEPNSTAFYVQVDGKVVSGPYAAKDTAQSMLRNSRMTQPDKWANAEVVELPSIEDEDGWHTAPLGIFSSKTAAIDWEFDDDSYGGTTDKDPWDIALILDRDAANNSSGFEEEIAFGEFSVDKSTDGKWAATFWVYAGEDSEYQFNVPGVFDSDVDAMAACNALDQRVASKTAASSTYEIKKASDPVWTPVTTGDDVEALDEAVRQLGIGSSSPSTIVLVKSNFNGSVTVFNVDPLGNFDSVQSYEQFYGAPYSASKRTGSLEWETNTMGGDKYYTAEGYGGTFMVDGEDGIWTWVFTSGNDDEEFEEDDDNYDSEGEAMNAAESWASSHLAAKTAEAVEAICPECGGAVKKRTSEDDEPFFECTSCGSCTYSPKTAYNDQLTPDGVGNSLKKDNGYEIVEEDDGWHVKRNGGDLRFPSEQNARDYASGRGGAKIAGWQEWTSPPGSDDSDWTYFGGARGYLSVWNDGRWEICDPSGTRMTGGQATSVEVAKEAAEYAAADYGFPITVAASKTADASVLDVRQAWGTGVAPASRVAAAEPVGVTWDSPEPFNVNDPIDPVLED